MPGAGAYRHRITIQQATETRDTFGEAVPTWGTYAERYAEILPQSGREFIGARQLTPELSHLIRLRTVAGVTPKMRAVLGSRVFDILAVLDDENRGIQMTLACRELVAT